MPGKYREARGATVYRVAPGAANTWNVFADPAREPIARFDEKSAAVRYAMRLARGKAQWPSLLGATGASGRTAPPLAS
jgi:hypothetical protein